MFAWKRMNTGRRAHRHQMGGTVFGTPSKAGVRADNSFPFCLNARPKRLLAGEATEFLEAGKYRSSAGSIPTAGHTSVRQSASRRLIDRVISMITADCGHQGARDRGVGRLPQSGQHVVRSATFVFSDPETLIFSTFSV